MNFNTNNITCIGFTGKMYSGKDTASYFFKKLISQSVQDAFAAPLKEILMNYFGFTHDQMYDPNEKTKNNVEWGMTNREAMQRLGTECIRKNFHKDAWIKIMEKRIQKHIDMKELVIISDVRFDNEANLIRKMGGIIIEVIRPQKDELYVELTKENLMYRLEVGDVFSAFKLIIDNVTRRIKNHKSVHPSERGINNNLIDFTIYNDGTIENLYEEIVMKVWQEPKVENMPTIGGGLYSKYGLYFDPMIDVKQGENYRALNYIVAKYKPLFPGL